MEIILLENLINLGKIGDKVTVKNGYGRNFLLKYGKALRFNKDIELKKKFIKTADLVNKKTIVLKKECKENGDLYGSIKPKEITNMITSQLNADVSPSQILLKEELNKIGSFKASINFHSEVQATISIKIDKIQSK